MNGSATAGPRPDVPAPAGGVAICCLTFRRPEGLRRVLRGIAELDLGQDVPPESVRVVIVDNDPEASGRPVVEEMRAALPFELRYAVEPRRGIPYGRNTAIAEGGDDVEYVAFLDDDEAPDPAWLRELLSLARRADADVVTGPVIPVYDQTPPAWVVRGGFFERRRHRSGERLHYARTSNVLIRRDLIARWQEPFPTAFGMNGGDDTYFFKRAHLGGASIVWSDEATVREWVPVTRVTTRWLMTREYRRGNTLSLCLRMLEDSPARRVKRVGAALASMAHGVGLVALGLVRGRRETRVEGLRRIWFGGGLLSGLTGKVFSEYTSVHGR